MEEHGGPITAASWARFGRAVRADRERKGLGREDVQRLVLANGHRISTRTIQDIENGKISLTQDQRPGHMLHRVIEALEWPDGYWVGVLVDGKPLFPWSPAAQKITTAPISAVASRLHSTHGYRVNAVLEALAADVERARQEIASLGLRVTPPNGYAAQHSDLATRVAARLISSTVHTVLENADENDAHSTATHTHREESAHGR